MERRENRRETIGGGAGSRAAAIRVYGLVALVAALTGCGGDTRPSEIASDSGEACKVRGWRLLVERDVLHLRDRLRGVRAHRELRRRNLQRRGDVLHLRGGLRRLRAHRELR